MEKTIVLDTKLYPLSSIYSACYVFLDRAYIRLEGDPQKEVKVVISAKEGENLELLEKEFHNELLNYLNYSQNLKENQDVVKLIVEKALFSASPKLTEEVEEKEIQELIEEFDKKESQAAKEVLEKAK